MVQVVEIAWDWWTAPYNTYLKPPLRSKGYISNLAQGVQTYGYEKILLLKLANPPTRSVLSLSCLPAPFPHDGEIRGKGGREEIDFNCDLR
jgi:hypothetical protein